MGGYGYHRGYGNSYSLSILSIIVIGIVAFVLIFWCLPSETYHADLTRNHVHYSEAPPQLPFIQHPAIAVAVPHVTGGTK